MSDVYYRFFWSHNTISFIRDFPNYDKIYEELAQSLVPWQTFKKDHENLTKNVDHCDPDLKDLDVRDYCLVRLLEWFKNEFFSWMDNPNCSVCDNQCHLTGRRYWPDDKPNEFKCSNVELYQCDQCDNQEEFPRINHAGKLLETRKGRCGEWALAFAYLCYVFEYKVRHVVHFDDHVWVEVFSEYQKRWIHCDPCENAFDNPLLYECGWKKPSILIIAYGMKEIRDVTWRYVSRWRDTASKRRELFDEIVLLDLINEANQILQSNLPKSERDQLTEQWLMEIIEFIRLPGEDVLEPNAKAQQGRTSGSLQWRLCRAETCLPNQNYCFKIKSACDSVISYDCRLDSYIFKHNDDNNPITIEKWNSGCFLSENIFRKIEHDWKMCYLSRKQHSMPEEVGRIVWRIQFDDHSTKWKSIHIQVNGKTFNTGHIQLTFIYYNKHRFDFQLNQNFIISRQDLNNIGPDAKDNADYFEVEAKLMNGTDWQHAQLFRQSTSNNNNRQDMLLIKIFY